MYATKVGLSTVWLNFGALFTEEAMATKKARARRAFGDAV
jgi:hypothetical protein